MNATILIAALTLEILRVDPYPVEKRHPDRAPAGATELKTLEFRAAIGERETAAFDLRPSEDVAGVDVVFSPLKGPDGAVIPADAFDVRVVKHWWRPCDSWTTDRVGDLGHLELTPDMLLHDDALVKVDESSNRVNFVRADYRTGSVYLNMREPGRESAFNDMLEPVRDAPRLKPVDLRAGRYREFFALLAVPDGAKPGAYAGTVKVVAGQKTLAERPVSLTVYPFVLPRARTHYDTAREYRMMMFNQLNLRSALASGKDLAAAETKVRNVARACARHNFLYPADPGEFASESPDDDALRTLEIWRAEGLPCDRVLAGSSNDGAWMRERKAGEAMPDEVRRRFTDRVALQLKCSRRWLGHGEWYFYASDEGGPDTQRGQMAFWRIVKDLGGKVFATTMGPMYKQVNWLTDEADVAARCSWTYAGGWHAAGATALTYAGTFTGPECPDLWRRTKGIRYYFADFDGLGEYIFYDGRQNRWNDLHSNDTGYRQMGLVFPTQDGLVPTVAFDGLREAFDDVRYYSLLRLLAEKAIGSGDAAKRARGRAEIAWFDSTDPELVRDLDAFRAEVAARIVALQALVGAIAPEPAVKPLALPPRAAPAPLKSGAELVAQAKEWAAANRYDLAVPALEKRLGECAGDDAGALEATVFLSKLLCETKRRDEAVAHFDALLKRDLKAPQRFAALAGKFDAMLTDLVFEERFTRAQIDAARETLDACGGLGQTSQSHAAMARRFDMLKRLIAAAGFGRHFDLAMRLADDAAAKGGYSEPQRLNLIALQAETANEHRDWKGVIAYVEKAKRFNLDGDRNLKHKLFLLYAPACEQTGEWAKARDAYEFVTKAYSPKDETERLFKRYVRRMSHCAEQAKKLEQADPGRADKAFDADTESLSLDE